MNWRGPNTARQFRAWKQWRDRLTREEVLLVQVAQRIVQSSALNPFLVSFDSQNPFRIEKKLTPEEIAQQQMEVASQRIGGEAMVNVNGQLMTMAQYQAIMERKKREREERQRLALEAGQQ